MNYLVGLTGGIGSGKSTVANLFGEQGARIVDTDLISHQLTQTNGAAIPTIRTTFGEDFIDSLGALNRSKMRNLIFTTPAEKLRLESILHPLIHTLTRQQASSSSDAPYTLVVVPLLFESGRYTDWLQYVIAVDCPEDMQISRTMRRSKLDETAVRAIMAQQISRSERTRLADETLHNDGTLANLKKQVIEMHNRLCALAAKSN